MAPLFYYDRGFATYLRLSMCIHLGVPVVAEMGQLRDRFVLQVQCDTILQKSLAYVQTSMFVKDMGGGGVKVIPLEVSLS